MIVALLRNPEYFHTEPADVSSAIATLHVVTTRYLLDRGLATRAVSGIVLHLPCLERFVVIRNHVSTLLTSDPIVVDSLTGSADGRHTSWTGFGGAVCRYSINHWTVWTRAVLIFIWMLLQMSIE